MKMIKRGIFMLGLFLTTAHLNAQMNSLGAKIGDMLKTKSAIVGVSIAVSGDTATLNINNDFHYPMQSVFKFPIALAVLSEVDKGNLSLEQEISITKKDLSSETWSPISEKFPNGTTLTVGQIIEYTVAQSDNIGCDILLRLIGGTNTVESFLKANHFADISIKANEEEMHKDWDVQYQNWTTPAAMNKLLKDAYYNTNDLLSQESHDFIWKVMRETTTGGKRLRGQLPQHTVVAHKTGTSGAEDGINAATNDVGVITLPDGRLIFISLLVADSREVAETNEQIIADIAKLAWDYYMGHK